MTSSWIDDYLTDPGAGVGDFISNAQDWVIASGPVVGPVAVVGAVVGLAARRFWRRRCHTHLTAEARMVTVRVPPQPDPTGGTALWSHLVGLLRPAWHRLLTGQPHLAFEFTFSQAGVGIRLWVPGAIPPGLVERAVEAAWPGAHTSTTPAEAPLPLAGPGEQLLVAGGELRLARAEALPLRIDFAADPLRGLLGAPVGLGHNEHACVQVLARPATGRRLARARRGSRSSTNLAGHLLDMLTPSLRASRRGSGTRTSHISPEYRLEMSAQGRASVNKQRSSQFETVVRYGVSTLLGADATDTDVRLARAAIRGRAHALATTFATYTEHNHFARRRLRRPAVALAERRLGRGDLLSVPELAAIAHLPTDDTLPGVQRAGARAIAPPPGIPATGHDVKPLGRTDSGHSRPVGLRVADARHHMHVIGATGSGKSTLLAQLVLADAEAGRAAVVIDPKGDLVTDLLSRLPAAAADRVVLFDADSRNRPPCLNPLDGGDPDLAVDNLVSIFRRVYSAFWGPRTDDVMRAACLTLRMTDGVATLADVPKLLSDPAYRARTTAGITDPVLRGFWTWYDDLSDASRSQVIAPLMNKLRAFLLRRFVRDTVAAGRSTVDMKEVLDNGGICLVRIPKGSLGDETARLIGSIVVANVWQVATARARTPQRDRHDATLMLDEFHNFLNLPYAVDDMLPEARALRLSLVLAHQNNSQLPREMQESISANARNKFFFNVSPEDAHHLARHTTPRISPHDLSHYDAFHAAVRLVVHGAETEPFTVVTEPLPPAVPGRSRLLRSAARNNQRVQPKAVHTRPDGDEPASRRTADPRRGNTSS
ncbi:type IV secretion system DNA-binding domain-containing protein [Lentzea sp. BCCO 10_0061]|uniref:Type IV secretion system DNA-binding domain-containing protein n=1 Tax=Lentzea sokolovensis TaxID=3095429 RepID=A0ABU4VC28_9PSEU|nr:type IV secretion system DNA-binding domain-containing protein [Lentzea sp. BCCO 10_0061]MDX8148400.1 type IV secretion system DNA-binding domain-containing protein [Lentzea sp. BCCO 10_0061]